MAELKKVINGLVCCKPTFFEAAQCYQNCPYDKYGHDKGGCVDQLISDALSLLKAQEPRVMTLEESGEDIEIWYESINGACGYGDLCYDSKADLALYTPHGIKGVEESAYNKTWRCWTSKPTDEQRAATPWAEPPKGG